MTVRAILLWCLVLVAAPASGQGVITGVATGPGGSSLPGVLVELFATGTDADPLRTTTGVDGRYELRDVPAGTYDLRATLPGFQPFSRDGIVVTNGQTVTTDATLAVQVLERPEFRTGPPPSFGGGLLPPFEIPQEPGRPCLHENRETPAERARRVDAEQAMRLIARALRMFQGQAPTWEELADSPAVALMRREGGLATRLQWGAREPLPGWGLAWVTSDGEARYALVDMRDPCGFSISSESLGRPRIDQRFRILPLS
jgi:hypothetical protein